jgi:sterol desaturase/sphingolipid hydroxylase (fatty acid hydroxylase superfamily)
MRIVWIPGAFAIVVALWFLGRFCAKTVAKKRVEYDPEKMFREYIPLKKTWLAFIVSIAIGIIFFYIALGMKTWYLEVFDDGTTPHSKGYVYEVIAGAYAMFVTYFSAIMWFPHDGMYLPAGDSLKFSLVSPIAMLIIPPFFAGVPKLVTFIYTGFLCVILFIRHLKIHFYNKLVDKLERENKYIEHNSKNR